MQIFQALFPGWSVPEVILQIVLEVGLTSWAFYYVIHRWARLGYRLKYGQCLACAAIIYGLALIGMIWIAVPFRPFLFGYTALSGYILGLGIWILGSLWAVKHFLRMPRGGSIILVLYLVITGAIELIFRAVHRLFMH